VNTDNCKPKSSRPLRKKIDRLLVGVVVGGAVGSILGIALAPKAGKETRKFVLDHSRDTWHRIAEILDEKVDKEEQQQKKGMWHFMNRLFFRDTNGR